jgi:hypothetical protein
MPLFVIAKICKKEETSTRKLAPTFKPYDNRQIQVIYDIEKLLPENHPARVVDEMVDLYLMSNSLLIIKAEAESPIIPKKRNIHRKFIPVVELKN